jgi:prevent-host-death family protein
MLTVNVHEAKTQLSRLLAAVEAGEEVVIARSGRPVARLVGLTAEAPRRRLGSLEGKFTVPDDFDDPLPDDLLALFEGR